jgi:alkylation response protein AidB-like acyl-CoA dehydrogenase
MGFLDRERTTIGELLPGLDRSLAAEDLAKLETRGGRGIDLFRGAGGPGLLVPEEYGGRGATALQAVRVQRAMGARSPSLAVGTTMHHFSMAGLVHFSATSDGPEWMLVEGLARENKLLASGFAEGRPGSGILEPTMTARRTAEGYRVSGSKRPCSLADSMDLLTASVGIPEDDGTRRMAIVLVPARSPGVTVTPFWQSFALAGAESEAVRLDDVLVPPELVIPTEATPDKPLDDIQLAGFLWFELLMTASYLGAASGLVERVLAAPDVPAGPKLGLVVEVEGAMNAVENLARQLDAGTVDAGALADALLVRYSTQDAIRRAAAEAVELLGGMAFITSGEVAYLASVVHGLGFHPPSRGRTAESLMDSLLRGAPLTVR